MTTRETTAVIIGVRVAVGTVAPLHRTITLLKSSLVRVKTSTGLPVHPRRGSGELRPIVGLSFAVVLALAFLAGCAAPAEPQVLVIALRDDATPEDIAALDETMQADSRVAACAYVSVHENPSEEQVAAVGTLTPEPDGDMLWEESSLEITLRRHLSERELQNLVDTVRADDAFERTISGSDDDDWWHVR